MVTILLKLHFLFLFALLFQYSVHKLIFFCFINNTSYQLPPLVTGKTALVVSPLISLMQDQVMSLKQRGIKAEFLGSAQTDSSVQTKAETGHFQILFMTPEKACLIPIRYPIYIASNAIIISLFDYKVSFLGHQLYMECYFFCSYKFLQLLVKFA